MPRNLAIILSFFFLFLSSFAIHDENLKQIGTANAPTSPMPAQKLRCEYLENPLGIDSPSPRFSWQLNDPRPGARQTAYRVWVGTDFLAVANGLGDTWDTGGQRSDRMLIEYGGEELKPFTRYFWTVQVWDQNGKAAPPAPVVSFETGMMHRYHWEGHWVADTRDIDLKPAPYFRKTFTPSRPIRSARVYIAAAGLYELYLNGQRIGDHLLDPTYTRFDRRNLYVTHDVTQELQSGDNAIGVLLGNGWYNHQSTAVWYFHEAPWRARPKFCLDLRITYEDGSVETISSNTDWKTDLSPVIFNSIYTAEHYDARLEQPGWATPNFDDSRWKNAQNTPAPSTQITAQALHPIRAVEEIPVKSLSRINDTTYLADFGRNISGITQLTISGEAGTTFRLKHAERLDDDGRADQSNIDVHYRPTDDSDPFQTDIFILGGRGAESFRPRFNYKGFQYVEVSANRPVSLQKQNLTAYFLHSDVPPAGRIHSSNKTLNGIWSAANNSYLANLFGYPTDCPQREKNGWTGDAHIASETGLYNFDGITVYEKWLDDHRDEQQPNGVLPAIIPTDGWGYHWANGPDWTSTIAIIPWNLYLFYGDTRPLEENYDNLKRYVDHITERSQDGLTDWGLGDWVPVKSKAPKELTSSAYYYVDATILSKSARLLGKTADYEKYSALADQIKKAVNAKYLDESTGIYGDGLQTELSVPLQWGLVPEHLKTKVAENLAKRVTADDEHIDVGLLGAKAILNSLSENGHADLAYRVAAQETFPSWGWWIVNGATTLYENWPIDAKSDISMNHIMFGEISAWMYKALGGIFPDEAQPGFKNIVLKPNFVAGLDAFEAQHDGPYGTIVSKWARVKEGIEYEVVIPPNSTATLHLPGRNISVNGLALNETKEVEVKERSGMGVILQLPAGKYDFRILGL
jgi:alpha-L-rhamnosidase